MKGDSDIGSDASWGIRRKPVVKVEQSEILAWLEERRSATLPEIAEHFDVSEASARRKAEGLVYQGKLLVQAGRQARPSIPRRYELASPKTSQQD